MSDTGTDDQDDIAEQIDRIEDEKLKDVDIKEDERVEVDDDDVGGMRGEAPSG